MIVLTVQLFINDLYTSLTEKLYAQTYFNLSGHSVCWLVSRYRYDLKIEIESALIFVSQLAETVTTIESRYYYTSILYIMLIPL